MNSSVTVMGLGNMGAALAARFLVSGVATTVWNRTASKAASLSEAGAHVALDPEEALWRSAVCVVCVEDYSQVRDLLSRGVGRGENFHGRTIVNLTWGTVPEARDARDWVEMYGGRYLDGAILDYPANMGPNALVLYSGDKAAFDEHAELLSAIARPRFEGADPAAANALGMAGALFHNIAVAGFYEAAAYAAQHGIAARTLFDLTAEIGFDLCARAFSDGLTRIESDDYHTDQSTIGIHFDTTLVQEAGFAEIGQAGTLNKVVRDILESAISAGEGGLAMSALYRRFLQIH
ncbi:hypothetical protein C8258_04360 [Nocardia sp. MDA0666]|uniref:NAD(P)-dependent oxidoreductase n=1 Tax=Nocardia sp. MDA0666 TaxID=2135448 RepID=UPI000D131952|nr:hypothetical protein C8258_04360 [Nocardia sp. MDA0666]